jgi:hypothetical protein
MIYFNLSNIPIIIRHLSAGIVEIKGPNLNSYQTNHSKQLKDSNRLQNGQILKAIVINSDNNKVLLELLEPKLSIKLEANNNLGFKMGQTVALQIANLGPPVSINVLANTDTATQLNSKVDKLINTALRLVLPKQTSMTQLLSNLQYLSIPSSKLNQQFPQEVLDLSRTVFQRLPGINDVKTAAGIKQALLSSGNFLEQQLQSSILNKVNFSNIDTRTALLRLAESIRSNIKGVTSPLNKMQLEAIKPLSSATQTTSNIIKNQYPLQNNIAANSHGQNVNTKDLKRVPSNIATLQNTNAALNELLRNIESSLAKTQYNQLQHFVVDDQTKTNWLFDVPIRREDGSDVFHFKFTKDDNAKNNRESLEWSVTLSFSLEKLGDISIQIYLQNNKIGATVWASQQETYNLFNQHMSTLQKQMENSGIVISNIRCNKGEIPVTESNDSQNILDEKV